MGLLIVGARKVRERKVEKDLEVYKKILELLPSDSYTISYLRKNDFGGRIERQFSQEIDKICDHRDRPEFFFINKDLEKLRVKLFKEFYLFNLRIMEKCFVCKDDDRYYKYSQYMMHPVID